MRTLFIVQDNKASAWLEAPWAVDLVEVDGGYMAFESMTDYEIWRGQE